MVPDDHTPHSPDDRSFLNGGGDMGARIRAYDWTRTPLGPPERWPAALKTAVRIMLTSRQAMWIGWGPELTYLYNDPYKAIIGGKHPTGARPADLQWCGARSGTRSLRCSPPRCAATKAPTSSRSS